MNFLLTTQFFLESLREAELNLMWDKIERIDGFEQISIKIDANWFSYAPTKSNACKRTHAEPSLLYDAYIDHFYAHKIPPVSIALALLFKLLRLERKEMFFDISFMIHVNLFSFFSLWLMTVAWKFFLDVVICGNSSADSATAYWFIAHNLTRCIAFIKILYQLNSRKGFLKARADIFRISSLRGLKIPWNNLTFFIDSFDICLEINFPPRIALGIALFSLLIKALIDIN